MENLENLKDKGKELIEITKKLNNQQKEAVLYIATGMLLSTQAGAINAQPNQTEANA